MQMEWYESSPRVKRKCEAFFATPAGKKARERYEDISHPVLERNIRAGFVPPPDVLAAHEEWLKRRYKK